MKPTGANVGANPEKTQRSLRKPSARQPILLLTSMVNPFLLLAILYLAITHATALPAPRATDSVVPLPTPPAGSKVVFVGATDPGIIWSPAWQTLPSACSSGTMRAMSAVGFDVDISYVATYNFRGSGIYVNLQSGNAVFTISIDTNVTTFGNGAFEPVPANCTYDFSATGLEEDDHVFMIQGLWSSISMDSYWNLGLESLAIIQLDSDSSPSNPTSASSTAASSTIPSRTSSAGPPSGTDSSSPSASGSTVAGSRSHGGLSTADIIGISLAIPGALASLPNYNVAMLLC
ncbi:hypothetical protein C8F04DRAFT_1078511 [Mycena alexandri]|uniref:Uncharacterized protein n=1 Tax=Mycena alexandri TaxID=1745969 RepID=A0AAD6T9X6_9AGAR|nr:hypothetical protein C8F04DRAFT_1078511 [Mycena alexandri]